MFKIFLLSGVIATTFLFGNFYANKLRKRVENLQLIHIMLDEILLLIRYKSATIFEIMQKLCSIKELEKFNFLIQIKDEFESSNKNFSTVWDEKIELINELCFSTEDKKIVKSIGEILGKTDQEGQINSLNYIKNELDLKQNIAREDEFKKSKLYRSLGILSGAFVAIMLI